MIPSRGGSPAGPDTEDGVSTEGPEGGGRALLVVDLIDDFRHEDGGRLAAVFAGRVEAIEAAIGEARRRGWPVVYCNDNDGVWDGDAPGQVRRACEEGLAREQVSRIAPLPGDRFIVKPRWSAFDRTPLDLVLDGLGVTAVTLVGSATEMCVRETAIDARRRGLEVRVLPAACLSVDPERERLALRALEDLFDVEVGGR